MLQYLLVVLLYGYGCNTVMLQYLFVVLLQYSNALVLVCSTIYNFWVILVEARLFQLYLLLGFDAQLADSQMKGISMS
jgi:hypothetical protein